MKVLLLDDEADGLQAMRKLLETEVDVEVVGEARNVAMALELTLRERPDVAFVDVHLRGETAFDFLGGLTEHEPRLIFVTAYDQYAVRGFECNALDYLLKPVSCERIQLALNRVRKHHSLLRGTAGMEDSILVRFGHSAKLIPWRKIQYIESQGNYTRVVTTDGVAELVHKTLKEWIDQAPIGQFAQTHRSTLVQLQAISEARALGSKRYEIVLSDGTVIPVSRLHWPVIKNRLFD